MNNNIAKEVHQKPSVDQDQQFSSDNNEPLFKEFTWYEGGMPPGKAYLVQDTRDMADGLAVILGMIEANDVTSDTGAAPLFTAHDRGQLIRMAIASTRLLSNACDRDIQASNEIYRRRAQAGAQQ